MNNHFLPYGFYDKFADEASKELKLATNLITLLEGQGFTLVKTPLVEYSLGKQSQDSEKSALSFLYDGEKILIAPDPTLAIGRFIRSLEVKSKTKLCYWNQYIHKQDDKLEQNSIVGFEVISSKVEITDTVKTAISIVQSITGVDHTKLQVVFYGYGQVSKFIKDPSFIKKISEKNYSILNEVDLVLKDKVKFLLGLHDLSKIESEEFTNLKALASQYPDIKFSLDFSVDSSNYYTDTSFQIISDNAVLVKGGNYEIENNGKTLTASGASVYLERVV